MDLCKVYKKFIVKKLSLLNLFKILFIFCLIDSCSYPKLSRDELIYDNDFESDNFTEIDGKATSTFNNSTVLGDFNNDGFTLHLENTGEHDYVFISFDLYVHGTWDGNFNRFPENDKPDKWIMELNPNMDLILTLARNTCYYNNSVRLIIVSATMDDDEPIYRSYFQLINDNLLYPIKQPIIPPKSISNIFT